MGPDFMLPFNNGEIYIPLSMTPEEFEDRSRHFLRVLGRLKQNVTTQKALQDVNAIAASLAARYPDSNKGWSVSLRTLEDVVIPQTFKDASSLLFGAALLVLVISCLNVANLLTARMMGRHREISIRRAMGATAPRLFAQLFTESVLIALFSGVVGILLAVYGVDLLHALHPENIPRLNEIRVDPVVLLFAIASSFLTVVLFGTLSARQSLKQDLQEGLKEGSLASTTGKRRTNVRNFLVILEAALSLVLLICAGLLMKSFMHLQDVDLGFEPDSVLAVKTTPVQEDSDSTPIGSLYRTLLAKARTIPGVENAAITSLIPMGPGNSMTDFSTQGPSGPNTENVFAASYRIVSPGYFKTMKIGLMKGEYFSESHPGKTLIIDEFARNLFWPDQDPVGQRVYISGFDGPFEITGIVRRVKSSSVESEPSPMLYLSNLEVPSDEAFYLLVRTARNPVLYADALQKTIREADPNLITGRAMPASEFVAESLSQRRFNLVIFGIFAGVALMVPNESMKLESGWHWRPASGMW